MSDDWGWFFTSAEGRANILRDEVESLGSQLSSATRTSSRLSSQLATLSGSIETRLNALSAAFDAFVELGDVREQLAGHPDTSAVRREVLSALESLAAGRPAEPVDARELPYWLPYAMNAVSAIAAGAPDPQAEQLATQYSPEAELFVVATSGALGHGATVAERVPGLLICDGTLSPQQVALWTAAYTGVFGPVLDQVRPQWSESLEVANRRIDWAAWVRSQAGESGQSLSWLHSQTAWAEVAPAPAATGASEQGATAARDSLRAVIMPLINQGLGAEVALLERARELRQRIENPAAAAAQPSSYDWHAGSPKHEQESEASDENSVAAQVRRGFAATRPGSAEHAVLLRWIRPGLESACAELSQQLQVPVDTRATVSGGGQSVTVTSAGAVPTELEAATSRIRSTWTLRPTAQLVGAGAAAVLAVGALVLLITGNGVAAFLVLVLALVSGGYAMRQRQLRRDADDQVATQLRELTQGVTAQQQKITEREAVLRSERQQQLDLAERVRRQLGEVAAPSRD